MGWEIARRLRSSSRIIAKPRFSPKDHTTSKPQMKKDIQTATSKINGKIESVLDNVKTTFEMKNPIQKNINGTVYLDSVFDNMKPIFDGESTFDKQLDVFLNKVAINDSEIKSRYELTCRRLEQIFQREVYNTCKVYNFGSTVTGLGFKNCDLDIYLDLDLKDNPKFAGPNAITPTAVFTKVKRVLFKSNEFTNVVGIPKARTPIIKFIYLPTRVSCDISFKNSLAVHNSRLIRYYLSLDSRFWPSLMILQYWMSKITVLGKTDRLLKYSLTLLFLFYLQQPAVKLIPPVIELQKNCKPVIVDDWQVNFKESLPNHYQVNIKNYNKSIPEILQEFFEFYSKYDFKTNVICPLDGLSHNRTVFTAIDQLPDSMYYYKKYLETAEDPFLLPITRSVCLQDLTELNNNVAANVKPGYIEIFQKYCSAAAKIIAVEAKNNNRTLLPALFSLDFDVAMVPKIIGTCVVFPKNFLETGLPKNFESEEDKEVYISHVKEKWYVLVIDVVKKFLEKVLRFEVQLINPQSDNKIELNQQKFETNAGVNSNDSSKIILICKGDICTWRNRSKLESDVVDRSMSSLEKEIQITENLFADTKNKLEKMPVELRCEIIKKNNPVLVIVNLKCTERDKRSHLELASFLTQKIPKVVTKTLSNMQHFQKTSVV